MPHGYESFADAFATHSAASPYNAHYDRPAVLDLIGDVHGRDVLDAGCGAGHYLAELDARGAHVAGCDGSARLVELARERVPGADVRLHDLRHPLPWDDATFDIAVLALVIHHLPDPTPLLRELRRVLRPGGSLVVSTVHPTADWLRIGGSYFTDEMRHDVWNDGWPVVFRRAPLGVQVDEMAGAGFLVERIVEMRPAPSMTALAPALAQRLDAEPGFIALRLLAR